MATTLAVQKSACGISGCTTCKPHRVAHWLCAQCGGGPYRFDATDPGKYRVLRPHFERSHQRFVTDEQGTGRHVYTVRRICSQGCWQAETRSIRGDEQELAERRPDLAPVIHKKLEAEQDAETHDYNDDLGINPGQF